MSRIEKLNKALLLINEAWKLVDECKKLDGQHSGQTEIILLKQIIANQKLTIFHLNEKLRASERIKAMSASEYEGKQRDSKPVISTAGLLNPTQAAAYLGIKPATLAVWRSTNRRKLDFVKIGGQVRYKKSDLDMFISEHTKQVG